MVTEANFGRGHWFMICGICFLVTLGLARAFDLMVVRGSEFRSQADENRLFRVTVPAERGNIIDRHGLLLATNSTHYYLATTSAQILFGNEWSLPEIPAEQAMQALVASPSSVLLRTSRAGTIDQSVSHLIGYTGYVTDIGNNGKSTQYRVGRTGLELTYESILAGVPGKEVLEISAQGVPQRTIMTEAEPKPGESVQLSVDLKLSQTAYSALTPRAGAVVVMDVESGALLVLTSSPSYTIASLSAALKDKGTPLLNRALASYPPGSTFKMMTAIAALQAKTITAQTLVDDQGELKLGNQTFGNWYWRQYGKTEGEIALVRAIARSNDIYFYTAAASVGPDRIDAVASQFGYGKRTGVEISAESRGALPNSAWKEKKVGEKWYTGDTYNMGIGQGYILATPAQVTNMTATLARRGTWCPLTLLYGKNQACTEIDIDQTYISTVIEGMVAACSVGGTASVFFPLNESAKADQKIACKTGTAEFGAEDDQGRKRTHGWFTLFYPTSKPKVAITVFVESSELQPYVEGSKDAAPVALKVFEAWKSTYDR